MFSRFGFSVAVGALVTAALFLLMQALIKSDRNPFDDAPLARIVDFVPVVEDVEPQSKRKPPKKLPPPDEPPPDLPKVVLDPTGESMGIEVLPPLSEEVRPPKESSGFVDGEMMPFFKVRPTYPSRAAARGIEGFVLLEFTVLRTGAVHDPRVIEASPPGMFDRAVKEAALKFKYKPRVVNGTPIDVSGVLNRITFRLRND
ncbi:MAG: energy transducer TonB [Gammaproteobacteria bacterium]|nr:energy transducer TonB [Gammaproteobacteria bacterium]